MPEEREKAWDAMDWLLDRLESDDAVAYAEVAGVYSERSDAVVTGDGPRNSIEFTESSVWFRVFTDGAADYRHATNLSEENLEDVVQHAIRGGEMRAQGTAEQFDAYTTHRAAHGGWASEGTDALSLDQKLETIEDAIADAGPAEIGRVRTEYADAHIEEALGTTTGSTVQTTVDRAQTTVVVDPDDGPKVRRHAGGTTGAAFLDGLPDVVASATDDARTLEAADPVDAPAGEATIALSPQAAGQLFHFLSHYLEADTREMGLSPYHVGDRIGPDGLTIEDGIRAGSWGASAYDAELRPSTPEQLVVDGEVKRLLHNTTTASEAETYPAGNAVRSLDFDQPPRIHARHLEVAAGEATPDELRAGADVYVERFGDPWLVDELERAQRTGYFPASAGYAENVAREMGDRPDRATAEFPLAEAYRLDSGDRTGRIDGVSLSYDPEVPQQISAFGVVHGTVTGVCEKHKSRLPYAVMAPGIRLRAVLTR